MVEQCPDFSQSLLLERLRDVLKSPFQHTLAHPIQMAGVGLHTGVTVDVEIFPAEPSAGRYFVRTDLDCEIIPAQIGFLRQTVLSTELGQGDAAIRTVEHVLAALYGLGIDNARIEVNGPELPLLDGSVQQWVAQIVQGGWTQQPTLRRVYTVEQPVWVRQGEAFIAALPAEQTRLTYGIEFKHPVIGQQWQSVQPEDFLGEVAPARTFGFAEEVEQLRERGLIKGGSLENALVCDAQGWLNPPLRYPDEPVRHKLLDLFGDLSLLGPMPRTHILAYKASHTLHTQLVQQLSQIEQM